MKIVRCKDCGWLFAEIEIIIPGHCPFCQSSEITEAKYWDWHETGIPDEQLKLLWVYFGDVPMNEQEEIEEPFLGFEAGTDRMDIWHWFDEHYSKGVVQLIYDVEEMVIHDT